MPSKPVSVSCAPSRTPLDRRDVRSPADADSRQWRPRVVSWLHVGLVTAIVVSTVGCFGSSRPPCELHEVHGTIVFGKKTPVGARITLAPKDGDWPHDSLPSATVGEDGSFRIGTFGRDDGAPTGTYVATLQWFPVRADGSVGGNAIPPKYASVATSPLTVAVTAGSNQVPAIRITR
jgi:hypothetical protein